MFSSYSEQLRKIAEFIERDNTPSDAPIGDQSIPLNQQNATNKNLSKKKKVVEDEVLDTTALPKQRRPRRELDYKKKWNEESSTENMQEYMKDYRNNGRDVEIDGPKSTYKKKL